MWKAYLVDDEELALKRLARLLETTGEVEVIGSTQNPETALEFLSNTDVDVMFLDIQMPAMNGFELLAALPRQPFVIFTTAYDQYALKAFEVHSIDYLLKPIEPEQLQRALAKMGRMQPGVRQDLQALVEDLARSLRDPRPAFARRIPIRVGERTQFLDLAQVTHFYAEDRLTYAVVDGRNYGVEWTIAELEQKLNPARFVRIHRGIVLNLDWLQELSPLFTGRLIARLKDQKRTELTVSRDRVRELKARLSL